MQLVDTHGFRDTPLYCTDINGEFIVTTSVVKETISILRERTNEEELVFWAGRQIGKLTFFLSVIAPKTNRTSQSVFISELNSGIVSKAARKNNISILAQVHSHPGICTFHSDGDDKLILFPYEGMLSLVAPTYASEVAGIEKFGVHQFQIGKWRLCSPGSVAQALIVVPDLVDCR